MGKRELRCDEERRFRTVSTTLYINRISARNANYYLPSSTPSDSIVSTFVMMPDDALWYLIFMGSFGLVVVCVGCVVFPTLALVLSWLNPPPTPEQQLEVDDAKDQKLQYLLSLVDQQSKVSALSSEE
jgi:hypothetical protein